MGRMQSLGVMKNGQYFHISSRLLAIRQFYRFPSYRNINNLALTRVRLYPRIFERETKSSARFGARFVSFFSRSKR